MMVKKYGRLVASWLCTMVASCVFYGAVCEAEIISVEGEYTYPFITDANESPMVVQEIAKEKAMRAAAENASVGVLSRSEIKNSKLTKDTIIIVAGSKLTDVITKITWGNPYDSAEGQVLPLICKVTAKVDADEITPEKILARARELQDAGVEEKDERVQERMQELLDENRKLKEQNQELLSNAQKQEVQASIKDKENKFMIAKYERDIDVYDYNNRLDWQQLMEMGKKLQDLDLQNAVAFRAIIQSYRNQNGMKQAVDYSNKVLQSATNPDLLISAYAQLGELYYNDLNDKETARKFTDKGIELVRKSYSAREIEDLVNGGDVEVDEFRLTGKTNTVRQLYILKSDLENRNPSFDALTVVEGVRLVEDKLYNIKYPTGFDEPLPKYSHDAEIIQATGRWYDGYGLGLKSSFYKVYARQIARLGALRNLAEGYGVELPEDIPDDIPAGCIISRLNHKYSDITAKYARQVGEARFGRDKDGVDYCEVVMEMPFVDIE